MQSPASIPSPSADHEPVLRPLGRFLAAAKVVAETAAAVGTAAASRAPAADPGPTARERAVAAMPPAVQPRAKLYLVAEDALARQCGTPALHSVIYLNLHASALRRIQVRTSECVGLGQEPSIDLKGTTVP